MIKNRQVALLYRLICFLFTLAGLLVHMGVFKGEIKFKPFMYYTIQSNFLALILFAVLTFKTFLELSKHGKHGSAGYYPRFEMVCVIDLLLTFIVYWVLLAPSSFNMGAESGLWTFSNLSVHFFVPLMCLIDYILFSKRGKLKYRDVYYVLIYPMLYVIFSTIAGFLGYVYRISSTDGRPVRFPYFFIDWDEVGAKALIYIFALIIFFLILSHTVYWIDRKRAKKQIDE